MRGLAGAVSGLVLALGAALLPASPAVAATTNGPLLIEGFSASLRNLDGTLHTSLKFGASVGEFNSTGDKLAFTRTECVDNGCTDDVTMIVVRTNNGDETEYGPINGTVWDVTWAPDDQQVAFVFTNDTNGAEAISRIPLSGTEPVLVTGETSTRYLVLGSTIDWSSSGILFAGSEGQDGSGLAVDFSQLYTVPAAGGSWSRFNVHYDPECDLGQTCYFSFENPSWAPGGGALAEVTMQGISAGGADVDDRYLGTIGSGQKQPSKVTDLKDNNWSFYGEPQYSPDGSKILFTDTDATDGYPATVNPNGTGRVRLPDSLYFFGDWQPCPNGVCAPWGATKLPSKITLSVSSGNGRIKATGTVSPNKAGQQVTITLKKLVQGSWSKVATAKPTLASGSTYSASWKQPTVEMCSLTAKYAGDTTHLAASTKLQFYC